MRLLSILIKVIAGILITFFLLVLFVRSPWGQNIIKNQLFSYVETKTNTTITVDRIFITFGGDITIEDLYVEDQYRDTLLYSRVLTADIPLWPIITGNGISVNQLDWEDARANVYRNTGEENFNYQFLIDAFVSSDPTQKYAADTTTSNTNISIGDISLQNIRADYNDEPGGMNASIHLGNLEVNMEKTDLNKMRFEVGSATLKNTRFTYLQSKPFPESADTTTSPLPFLVLNDIKIANVSGRYHSTPDGIDADVDIEEFTLDAPKVDLQYSNIAIKTLALQQSEVQIEMEQSVMSDTAATEPRDTKGQPSFTWPEWKVTLEDLDLSENKIAYEVNGAKPTTGKFDPNALAFSEFSLKGAQIYLKNKSTGGHLEELRFIEGSGISVSQVRFQWQMDDQDFNLSDLRVKTLGSELAGNVSAQYNSVNTLINEPDKARIDLNLHDVAVDVEPLYTFVPELKNNPYIHTLSQKSITGNFKAKGLLSSLRIHEAGIKWGSQTAAFAAGTLYNATAPDYLRFDFPNILFKSSREDINQFVNEDSLGIRFPDDIRLTAQLTGDMEDISTNAVMESTLGLITLDGSYQDTDSLVFTADLQTKNLQLDTLLQNPQLGDLSLTVKANGQGSDLYTMDAALQARIDSFALNNYAIHDWSIDGSIHEGAGTVSSIYQDSNLNVDLTAHVALDTVASEIEATMDVKGADLAALGLMDKSVKTAFKLQAYFKGNGTRFNTHATLRDGQILYEKKSYPTGPFDLRANVTPDTTSGSLNSRMMELTLQSNTSPGGFTAAISRHISSYLSDSIEISDSITSPVHVVVNASLRQDPLLDEIFLTGLQEMDTMKLKMDFDEKEKNLMAMIDIPYLNYSGIEIDSMGLSASSNRDHFNMQLGLHEIVAGPLTVNRTYFTNVVRDQVLYSEFEAKYQNDELIHIKTETSQPGDSLRIHFDPSVLVFDAKDWKIPARNQIRIGQNKIEFKNFRIQRGEQKITIDDNPGKTNLNISFQQFNISNLISYFNPDSLLATGNLNGRITLAEPLGDAALMADLKINAFHVMEVDMGVLSLRGETEDSRDYSADVKLQGGEVDLSAEGEYHTTDSNSNVNLDMIIDRISMDAVQSFSMGEIDQSSGFISGNFNAQGSMSNLDYDGQLTFNDASITPTILQTPFGLGSQQITFDNKGINLNQFQISDEDGNTFTTNGEIITDYLTNPSFDLTMRAYDFRVLNASKDDNDLFYGKASFDADATLQGDLNLPVLDLELDVNPGTDVTYIMPQGEANLNKQEGIVKFVNKENPETIMTEEEDEEAVVVTGYDINAILSLSKDAAIKVIISEQTGDHFKIAGEGDLNFSIDPTGRMSLSGIYTLQDGHYEMNLYNLVNRRFDIAEGSTVSWSGDPFDAKLDVRAIYDIETSPSSLMASQTSAADASVKNQYLQKIPFLVYLNVDGQLSEPELSFSLDMPENARGDMGGQVYGRIQQINQEDQLLNKQVFSLLVLGRFYPDSGSDGSSGGIVNVARDNLNQALSDQLNLFSDKLLGDTGLELNFGLDSYTDYQGQNPQNRTQLDIAAQKKFLDDRLIVKVGSEVDIEGGNSNPQEENPLIGNVSVEYLLTENGQFRVRGFRKNVYENVIDGQTIVSGLALIFTREFNKLDELWDPMVSKSTNSAQEQSDSQ